MRLGTRWKSESVVTRVRSRANSCGDQRIQVADQPRTVRGAKPTPEVAVALEGGVGQGVRVDLSHKSAQLAVAPGVVWDPLTYSSTSA